MSEAFVEKSAPGMLQKEPLFIRRRRQEFIFACLLGLMVFISVALLMILLGQILHQGLPWLSLDFLSSFPSRFASKAGIKSALAGSAWLILLTSVFSLVVGVGAAIFLEEMSAQGRLARFLEINIANLAGVPSVVYGILGLGVFVRFLGFGRSILAGALTLSLMILPMMIISSREALRSVPLGVRQGSFALGASPWQTTWHHVLPSAFPTILTGLILALSRAIGEAAPLILIGGVTYVAFLPHGPMDTFTALPIQIYNWVSRPQEEFQSLAAAGIIVLLGLLLVTNGISIYLRGKFREHTRW